MCHCPHCTAKPCPVLLMRRRWLILSPAQKLRLGQLLDTKPMSQSLSWAVQVAPVCSTASTSPAVLHSHKCAGVQQTGISAGLCLSSAIKRRQAAHGVLHVRDYVPHPPPKATAKLSPEHLGRVGQNQLSMDWGQIKIKPQRLHHPAGHSCCSTCPGTTARHRTALSSVTCQAMLGAVLQFLLHLTQSCSVRAARRDSRSHLLRGTDTQEIAL